MELQEFRWYINMKMFTVCEVIKYENSERNISQCKTFTRKLTTESHSEEGNPPPD